MSQQQAVTEADLLNRQQLEEVALSGKKGRGSGADQSDKDKVPLQLAQRLKGMVAQSLLSDFKSAGTIPKVLNTPGQEQRGNAGNIPDDLRRWDNSLLNPDATTYTPSTAQRRENPRAILKQTNTVEHKSGSDLFNKKSRNSSDSENSNYPRVNRRADPNSDFSRDLPTPAMSPTEKILMEKVAAMSKDMEEMKREREFFARTQEELQLSMDIAQRRWGRAAGSDDDNDSVRSNLSRSSKKSRIDGITPPPMSSRLTPLKVFESITRSKAFHKVVLKSDFNTFLPWKEYINSVLDGCWLISLAKINTYRIPPEDKWKEWDKKCREGTNIAKVTYDDIQNKVNEQIPVVSYLDENGEEHDFDITTNVDILHCATLMLFKKWPGIEISLYTYLKGSIDRTTMFSALFPRMVPGRKAIMMMYVAVHKIHQHNSFNMIQSKITYFNTPGTFRMLQNEQPDSFIKRLADEVDVINSMATLDNVIHITDQALFAKFLLQVRDIQMYSQLISQLEIGWKDVHGVYQVYTLQEYASHMMKIYLNKKERDERSNRHHDHRAMLAKNSASIHLDSSDSDPETAMVVYKSPSKQSADESKKKPCYKFRDTGSCNYGDKCRFLHDKSKPAQKAFLTKQDELQQDVENLALQVQHWKSKFKSQKKMDTHKKKLKDQNAQNSSKNSSQGNSKISGANPPHRANVATQDDASVVEVGEEDADDEDDIQADINDATSSESDQ